MAFDYINVEDAIARDGLRMVVVGDTPSPWGEAAKGIFHVKGIEWSAVRLVYDDEALKAWAGGRNGPIAMYDNEPPRSGWSEILSLAERLAPSPPLIPGNPEDRIRMFGLAHELLGEGGLAWSRRLQQIHAGLNGGAGFAPPVAKYLGRKYGYSPETGRAAGGRVMETLGLVATVLSKQREAGSPFVIGNALSAADIYCAATTALFAPLSEDLCAMDKGIRKAFEALDDDTKAAFSPLLIEHRDMIYRDHLELPLNL